MSLRLMPVHSLLAAPSQVEEVGLADKLPMPSGGVAWRLSQHQVDTYRALTAQDGTDVVFNTAMTGDGKSLAGQLPTLVNGWRHKLFAMYPTNELIRDQQRQAQHTWELWKQHPAIGLLDSSELDRRMASQDFSRRSGALLSSLRESDVVLTNPDIFHYIMQSFYVLSGKSGDAADLVFGPLVDVFQQFTFDEFHIFEAPQIVSVINALLLIDEMTQGKPRRFLFQSATPNPLMLDCLQRAGMSVTVVQGRYSHSETNPDPDRWRLILRGCELNFDQGTVEQWVQNHLHDVLLPFFLDNNPHAKGAIIVNSVAQARRLAHLLRAEFARFGLTVGENTGATSQSRRSASYECNLLVGTSTVDVGVDFAINFLLFESRDAGTFLQRLGRLGRHGSYVADSETVSFENRYLAYALVPPWTQESLFVGKAGAPPLLVDGAAIDRDVLTTAILQAYPQTTSFELYAREWGILQSMRVVRKLNEPLVRRQYEATRKRLISRYSSTFQSNLLAQSKRYDDIFQHQQVLYHEVTSFRGSSYFDCAILDEAEEGPDQIKTYDLLTLIASGELIRLDESEFRATADRWGLTLKSINCENPLAYFRLRGFLPDRRHFAIKLQQDVCEWGADRLGTVQVLTGFQLQSDFPQNIPDYNGINRSLRKREIPSVICLSYHPLQLKRSLRLPLLFPIYEFTSLDNMNGSIAFGREALLLHSALKRSSLNCGDGALIF